MPTPPSSSLPSDARPELGRNAWFPMPLFVLLSLAAANSGALWPVDVWHFEIERPPWAPPGWLFGPVWTVLYVMIGTSAWRVWRVGGLRRDRTALALFSAQWLFNFAWTALFFGLKRPGLALLEIVALLAPIVATALRFHRRDKLAAWLLAPYAAWVAFASVLNGAFWWLNRG